MSANVEEIRARLFVDHATAAEIAKRIGAPCTEAVILAAHDKALTTGRSPSAELRDWFGRLESPGTVR